MRKPTRDDEGYEEGPIGEYRVVDDFLPPPEELILKQQNVKVTISLSRHSVDFFKEQAKKNGTQYQKMIRRLLDFYVKSFEESGSDRTTKR